MYIYFYDCGTVPQGQKLWSQMSFIGHIAHLKARNCPSGPKTVPPRNLIVI